MLRGQRVHQLLIDRHGLLLPAVGLVDRAQVQRGFNAVGLQFPRALIGRNRAGDVAAVQQPVTQTDIRTGRHVVSPSRQLPLACCGARKQQRHAHQNERRQQRHAAHHPAPVHAPPAHRSAPQQLLQPFLICAAHILPPRRVPHPHPARAAAGIGARDACGGIFDARPEFRAVRRGVHIIRRGVRTAAARRADICLVVVDAQRRLRCVRLLCGTAGGAQALAAVLTGRLMGIGTFAAEGTEHEGSPRHPAKSKTRHRAAQKPIRVFISLRARKNPSPSKEKDGEKPGLPGIPWRRVRHHLRGM